MSHRRIGPVLLWIGLCAAARAQTPCEPNWNTAIGAPGVSGGYVAPLVPWNDGAGTKLFVGGSFSSAGGNGAAGYVAAWDRGRGSWSALGAGIWPGFTSAFVTSIVPFDPGNGERLVVAGWFARAGTPSETASLAMWNGQAWESLGTGWYVNSGSDARRGAVWAMAVWQGKLYIAGGVFPPGANVPEGSLAAWNGQAWTAVPSALTGDSPGVFSLAVFDDGGGEQLYASGRFTSIGGVTAPGVARWDGESWTAVGGLIAYGTFAEVNPLIVFDDGNGPALYAGAYNYRISTQPRPSGFIAAQVLRRSGATWTQMGQWLGTGQVEALAAFDDGAGAAPYMAGQALPEIKYLARFNGAQWTTVGGGFTAVAPPWPGVFGLGAWEDALYVGGTFTDLEGPPATNVVAWQGCRRCPGDADGDGDADQDDIDTVLFYYGSVQPPWSNGDLDGDGDVDQDDIDAVLFYYQTPC